MKLLLILTAALALSGCGNVQQRGDQLVLDLRAAFPDTISAISFENAPPLDPPTLFIDIDPPMEFDEEKAFLCEQVKPLIDAAGGGINATTTAGWYLNADC